MNTLMTSSSAGYACLNDLTAPGKSIYSARWDCHFIDRRMYGPNSSETSWGMRLRQVLVELDCLGADDMIWFTGTDLLVTNHRINVFKLIHAKADMLISVDHHRSSAHWEANNDSYVVRNTASVRRFLKNVLAMSQSVVNDQIAFGVQMERTKGFRVQKVDQTVMNSYPMHWFGRAGQSGDWKTGHLALHAAGAPNMNWRIKLLKETLPKVKK